MKKRFVLLWLILSLLLGGCWDITDVQELVYMTGIGFDYDGKEYIVYGQSTDFDNVAKQESGMQETPANIWLGTGRGKTVNDAFHDLYNSTYTQIFWGHATTILFTERMMKSGLEDVIDMINRYRELRYNIWLYATKESIPDVFSVQQLYNLPPLASILHEPNEPFRQKSVIPPVYVYEGIRNYLEPGRSAYIPSVSIVSNHWKLQNKPFKTLEVNGAYFHQDKKLTGYISYADLYGLQWLNRETVRAPVTIFEKDKAIASVIITKPKFKITPEVKNGKVYFDIKLTVKAYLNELIEYVNEEDLKEKIKQEIKKDIYETFHHGLKIKTDVYNLGDTLYKKNPKLWHQIKQKNPLIIDDDSIRSIDIFINYLYSGKYKMRTGSKQEEAP